MVLSARRLLCCAGRKAKDSEKVAGTSYAGYLIPGDASSYDPDFLDDQSLRQGNRLEAYQVSVIPFVRPRHLKEELNDQFRCRHPWLHSSISLSKLRNLQKDLREITVVIPDLDMSTVALAWVYFEKLVLADRVRKGNRKLLAGACLILAFKFNQRGDRASLRQLEKCIRKLDRKDQLNSAALRDAELCVFVWLKFGLHTYRRAALPHLQRMLKDMGTSMLEYYGPDAGRVLGQEWRPEDDEHEECVASAALGIPLVRTISGGGSVPHTLS